MKLNNKGLTLIELLVSVALVSTLAVFMYKLINDISYEKDQLEVKNNQLLTIAKIESKVGNLIFDKKINSISYTSSLQRLSINYEKDGSNKAYYLEFNSNSVTLKDETTTVEKWTLKDARFDLGKICKKTNNIVYIPIFDTDTGPNSKLISNIEIVYDDDNVLFTGINECS